MITILAILAIIAVIAIATMIAMERERDEVHLRAVRAVALEAALEEGQGLGYIYIYI